MPVNGTQLLLYKDQTAIGYSRETIVKFDVDLPDTTTKDSNGWKEIIPLVRGGTIQANGLTAYDSSLNFTQFADALIGKTKQTFYFKEATDPAFVVRGEGYITSVDEVGDTDSITEFNLEIKLTGVFTAGDERNWENIFEFWEDIATNWENT